MTDFERDKIDTQCQTLIKACQKVLANLKKSGDFFLHRFYVLCRWYCLWSISFFLCLVWNKCFTLIGILTSTCVNFSIYSCESCIMDMKFNFSFEISNVINIRGLWLAIMDIFCSCFQWIDEKFPITQRSCCRDSGWIFKRFRTVLKLFSAS